MDTPQSTNRISRFSGKFTISKLVVPAAVVIAIILLVGFFALRKSTQSGSAALTSSNKVVLPKPKASQTLNKDYTFSLKEASGKTVSNFKYTIESIEKRDEIIVKGKRAVAVAGRTFLIVNVKIRNDYKSTVSINARDYIRLTVNNSSDKLAADIHNDPVEVQSDSTKQTRLGFPINETDKNLTLLVGELDGKKDTIKLNLR